MIKRKNNINLNYLTTIIFIIIKMDRYKEENKN